jgi:cob(I)alamin adenosyltransferase
LKQNDDTFNNTEHKDLYSIYDDLFNVTKQFANNFNIDDDDDDQSEVIKNLIDQVNEYNNETLNVKSNNIIKTIKDFINYKYQIIGTCVE